MSAHIPCLRLMCKPHTAIHKQQARACAYVATALQMRDLNFGTTTTHTQRERQTEQERESERGDLTEVVQHSTSTSSRNRRRHTQQQKKASMNTCVPVRLRLCVPKFQDSISARMRAIAHPKICTAASQDHVYRQRVVAGTVRGVFAKRNVRHA